MSERTRRPPTDSPAETLTRQERELSPEAPVSAAGLTQRASALDASPRVTPQAETAERIRNSPGITAQRKTRDMMANSAGVQTLRKTAQGMHDSTAQRLASPPSEVTMADTMDSSPALQFATTIPGGDQSPEPSTVGPPTAAPAQLALKVKGNAGRRTALFDFLGGAAGLKLARDDDTQLVTITEETKADPASATLRARLKTIIEDAGKAAQITVNTKDGDIVGAFADWQRLDVPAVVSIEQQAVGAGLAMAIHEIWENYMAQPAGNIGALSDYTPAHNSAARVESAVATEVYTAQGSDRVADANDGTYAAFDYRNYYLVMHINNNTVKRVARSPVGTHRLTNYAVDDVDHAAADEAAIGAARDQLNADKLATAQITGFTRGTEAGALGLQRANTVLDELSLLLAPDPDTDDEAAAAQAGVPAPAPKSLRLFVDNGGAVAGAAAAGTAFVTITVTKPENYADLAEDDDEEVVAAEPEVAHDVAHDAAPAVAADALPAGPVPPAGENAAPVAENVLPAIAPEAVRDG